LSSVAFMRERGKDVAAATYDQRMAGACDAKGLALVDL
jgi:hypothetical protein